MKNNGTLGADDREPGSGSGGLGDQGTESSGAVEATEKPPQGVNAADVVDEQVPGTRGRDDQEEAELPLAKRPRTGDEVEERDAEAKLKSLPSQVTRAGLPAETNIHAFQVPDRPSPPVRADDKDGHYRYETGENLTSRYKILGKMGEGTFGRVLECWDRKHRSYVAIKVVRNVQKYRDAAMIELEVLNTLMLNDPSCQWHCVALREWFDYRGHICMVFEKLGPSLFDFLRKNRYKPFPLQYVQSFALQLIEAVAYLHRLKLVHTDLKPENILLATNGYKKLPQNTRVGKRVPETDELKLIDFGSATFEEQYHSTIVSTRHYRAPEVILGLGWSYPCDMWSIGCILVELLTGDALFQTHENLEHLAMMEAVLGRLPEEMVSQASRHSAKYFYKNRLDWPQGDSGRENIRAVEKLQTLSHIIAEAGELKGLTELQGQVLDLINSLLQYDPEKRITARQALSHKFFSEATQQLVRQATTLSPC